MPPERVWFMDVEGFGLRDNNSPIPFEVAIFSLEKEQPLVHTTVAYHESFVEMRRILDLHATRPVRAKNTMKKAYPHLAPKPYGRTPSELKTTVLEKGWTQNHTLLTWGTSRVDEFSFTRILQARNQVVVSKTEIPISQIYPILGWVNLSYILDEVTNIGCMKLYYVYMRLCPDGDITDWHHADADAKALKEIFIVMVKSIKDAGLFNNL